MSENYQKYIKDDRVAVLYSPRFGAGWYTWNTQYKGLVFDKDIVEAVLNDNRELAAKIAEEKYPKTYTNGAADLKIAWLDENTIFEITEYDGRESIKIVGQSEYLIA